MPTQTFNIGQEPRVILANCHGDLTIEAWDERTVEMQSDERAPTLRQEGDALVLDHVHGDVRLRVPADTLVSAEHVRGDASIRNIRSVTLNRVDGDCTLEAISGDARLGQSGGDLIARNIGVLDLGMIGGDLTI